MKKIIYALTPFCIYSFFVLLLYFLTFFVFPRLQMELTTYFFAFLYLLHELIGILIWGFILGKITQKRFASPKILYSLLFAIFSYAIMVIIGAMFEVFYFMGASRYPTVTINTFIDGLSVYYISFHSIGLFCSFFLGELHEYFILKKKSKEEDRIK